MARRRKPAQARRQATRRGTAQPTKRAQPAKGARPVKAGRARPARQAAPARAKKAPPAVEANAYKHPEATNLMRPEVGTQAQFKKKKPPKTYRYDNSLAPELVWDGQNPAREAAEACIKQLGEAGRKLAALAAQPAGAERDREIEKFRAELAQAEDRLRRIAKPFLNWAGKAERLSFDVPTLPLFIHERLSTTAIIETLSGHKKDKQTSMFDLWGDPQHSVVDQVTRAYEYPDKWLNRMILGDSLVAMNSLAQYEGLSGQVQMVYMDPPYGVKFGSNFQPFVRKRDVNHNDDEDMTREPEMVQAYRDTWELGLHSYLTYLRDRLLLARELLHPSGSIFVQISDENLHHVREVMDEVFGEENFVAVIAFLKTSGSTGDFLPSTADYLLFYAKDIERLKFRQPYVEKATGSAADSPYQMLELIDGTRRRMTAEEKADLNLIPRGARRYRLDNLQSQSMGREKGEGAACWFPVKFKGRDWLPGQRSRWKTNQEGMAALLKAKRLDATEASLYYVRYLDDFPVQPIANVWDDTSIAGFASDKLYVVQTSTKVVQRCLLMTTDPGDLVLDPTCGSGTTAYVAEQWGRRWITMDTSRVPLALARQRLLTATFPYYELKDEARGPGGGFVYLRKQNKKGEEVGGIIPHIQLQNIANNEPPKEEVLVDRPEALKRVVRVSGPFTFEATIPTPVDWEGDGQKVSGVSKISEEHRSFVDRMLEVLRKSPVLRLGENKTLTLRNVRPPAKSLSLSAEALVDATAAGQKPSLADAVQESIEKSGQALPFSGQPVAFVFGPENGAVSEKLVYEAAREAHAKRYTHLYVIGFNIQAKARELVEKCDAAMGVPATYVQATPDLMMGDLLKNMRSSQIFSVCGMPEIKVEKVKPAAKGDPTSFQVELLGLDVFDPTTMDVDHRQGQDVPAWFLDTDYNGLVFHVCQAFFPRTSAWENLKKALKLTHDEAVWDHLAGTVSAPFELGEHGAVAVKVIDDRGNELLVTKELK